MTHEGIPDQQTIGRMIEQRDALLRLIEQFKRAAGAENSPDPIGVIEKLRRDAEVERTGSAGTLPAVTPFLESAGVHLPRE